MYAVYAVDPENHTTMYELNGIGALWSGGPSYYLVMDCTSSLERKISNMWIIEPVPQVVEVYTIKPMCAPNLFVNGNGPAWSGGPSLYAVMEP